MRLPIVRRSELDHMRNSAQAWQNKAIWTTDRLRELESTRAQERKWHRFRQITVALWMLVLTGVVVGSLFFANENGPVVQNPSSCVQNYQSSNPIPGNKYQEIVNALWECGVYG